jgi:Flp pilus assembly protein TadG
MAQLGTVTVKPVVARERASVRRPREKGVALLMATLSLLMLVPLAGIAIDAGMAYIIKTRLSVAVDSACLAAARSLNRGLDLASQRDAARGVALRYFSANFPTDHFGTTGVAPLVNIDESQLRLRTVTVDATRRAPLYFMPILGEEYADVSVSGQATRRDSNIILVLDRSSSMNSTSSMPPMRTAAKSFVDRFSNGRDRLGLVVYHHASFRAKEPTFNFKTHSPTVPSLIDSTNAGGNTGTTGALNAAYSMLQTINEAGALNVVVFFTDGLPNGVVGNFNNANNNGEPDLLKSTSPCDDKDSNRIGVIVQHGGGKLTGTTRGIFNHTQTSMSNTANVKISNLEDCYMETDTAKMRDDIARMPFEDIWGNRTSGFTGAVTVDLTRLDSPYHVNQASMNTAIDQARRIRANSALRPVIYLIGLGDEDASEPPDHNFMKKMANTTDSPTFDDSQQTGMYIFVQVADQGTGLQEAFQRVAGEILRLSL